MNFSIENRSQKKGFYCFVDQILRINDDAKSICHRPELGAIILISKEVSKHCLFTHLKPCGLSEEVH